MPAVITKVQDASIDAETGGLEDEDRLAKMRRLQAQSVFKHTANKHMVFALDDTKGGAGDDSLYQVQPETRNPKLNLKQNPKPRAERVCGQ